MHVDGNFFNPDDGKQPKTFGLNFLSYFTIFNFLALYVRYISKISVTELEKSLRHLTKAIWYSISLIKCSCLILIKLFYFPTEKQ